MSGPALVDRVERVERVERIESLDPLRFPLHGSRLIEASAGTGKTYTIAALYVRLVLGHGGEQGYARALTPPEILVVTFTDAATQELRDRIRRRLTQAADYFLAEPDAPGGDALLRALRADYAPADWPLCARKLRLAAEWMDEAAVSTIHGWCNRMLREHAFASDSLFTQTLVADPGEQLAEAVRDYWRVFMAPLPAAAVAEVLPWWSGPQALQDALRRPLAHADDLVVRGEPEALLLAACDARHQRLAELKAPWPAWADEIEALLDQAVAGKRVNGRKLQARYYQRWLTVLRDWAGDEQALVPDLQGGWDRLSEAGLREAWTQGEPPAHPAFVALTALRGELERLPEARTDVLCHAARWVAQRFAQEQRRRAQMGFDDLLKRLAEALSGTNGKQLAERICTQFPVALIDEFQDTDPVQYRIFATVYGAGGEPAENASNVANANKALILIGDPKQAIYAFRGADLHTYLAARRACAGRLYTLKRNFRSTQAMVAASNRCFAAAEQRPGRGAFLLREEHDAHDSDEVGHPDNPLPFIAADANGRADALWVDGRQQTALTLWRQPDGEDGKAPSKGAYLEFMAQVCASRIVSLLTLAQGGRAGFGASSPDAAPPALRPLRPADLAVLVSNRQEAEAIRGALAARGVRSAYLSDRDSVYACAQAAELQHWLAACAEPDDPRRLRAALATATLGLDYAQIDALNHDEAAWEARVVQFRGYRERWRRQGVLPMLRRLLNDFAVPARLLDASGEGGEAGGERVLTDILHLAELLQGASALLDGEHALIRHLAEQRQGAGQGGDGSAEDRAARQIRLESDADLVQVVTVHKSKGLEYPLVFLPFACACRPLTAAHLPLAYHDADGRVQLAFTADEALLAGADRERLGEDLRKLYVALTRARYATWIGVVALATFEHSAFAHLLGGTLSAPALDAWRGDCAEIAIDEAPAASDARYLPAPDPRLASAAPAARRARRAAGERWWVASYSALRDAAGEALGEATGQAANDGEPGANGNETLDAAPAVASVSADTARADQFGEALATLRVDAAVAQRLADEPAGARPTVAAASVHGLHTLPAGAEVGSFLHGLLEAAARHGFERLADDPAARRDLVERRCRARGWAAWTPTLTDWLGDLLTTPLPLPASLGFVAAPLRLAGLPTMLAEMEFWMATRHVDVAALDRLIRQHTLAAAPRPALRAALLNGMLKGFIDLVFEHDGRYYVADYKSNRLGGGDAAYTPEALRAAMLEARYELQYVLYLVALHRLLKSRLSDYDYDRHVGGAIYLYLRPTPASGQGIYADRPPRALIEALDRLFAGDDGAAGGKP